MRSRLFPLPTEPRWRRLFGVTIFLLGLVFLRHLSVLFVVFVLLSRGLGGASAILEERTHIRHRRVLPIVVSAFAATIATTLLIGIRRVQPYAVRAQDEWRDWIGQLISSPALVRLRDATGMSEEGITAAVKDHAAEAIHYAESTAHVLLYLVIGFIVAIMFLFEREQLVAWRRELAPEGIFDTLLRWFGYVADALVVMVRMQLVVALVNTVLTLPVLILLGLKHVAMLSVLILVAGLVPVVGNVFSGAVLCIVAYETKGAWAVGVFVLITFVLHKIESYYLNPRLAAAHVHLPALVMVASLILFEHVLGVLGLFLSFPALYVGSRIHNDWATELEAEGGQVPAA